MDFVRFVVVGLGAGAIYALIAQGMVLIYRGSGVLNFAHGGFVMIGAYAYYQLASVWKLPLIVALVGAIVLGTLVGALVEFLVLRHMKRSSPLLRVVATLALLILFQAVSVLLYGSEVRSVPSLLPTAAIPLPGGVAFGADRLILLVIAVLSTAGLWWIYRSTKFGRLTSAVAENELVVASLGHSPNRIAVANWAIGAGLASMTGALIAPITYLQPSMLVMLVIPAIAVAFAASFRSFPIVLIAGLGLGVLEALMAGYVPIPGVSQSVPFIIVIVIMVIRGRGIPLRSYVLDRLPAVGSGRIPVVAALGSLVILLVLFLWVLSPVWISAFTVTLGFIILCLSVVLLTGYSGQLSLAQYSLAGFGGLVAARLFADLRWPFLLALCGALLITAGLGALVALPALRTRGLDLAVVTLGLGVVLFNVVLDNNVFSGGFAGVRIPPLDLFGLDISGITNPRGYAIFVTVLVFLIGIGLLNLRRGAAGRRMLAVRDNERAAAAIGVNVYTTKIFAFSAAAGIAALAGIALMFRTPTVLSNQFDSFSSILAVAMTVVGGVGLVGGGVMGGPLMGGGVASEIFANWHEIEAWLPLITSIVLLVVLVREPSGLWAVNAHAVRSLADRIRRPRPPQSTSTASQDSATGDGAGESHAHVKPRALHLEELRVTFGKVVAVSDISLSVQPGQIHGLIGPNGAGKTTVIDAASGFVRATGRVSLDGRSLGSMSARKRVRAGLARSFQSLELFEDLTVRENLAVAGEAWNPLRYLGRVSHMESEARGSLVG